MRTRLGNPAGRDNGLSKSLATLPGRAGKKPYEGQEAPLTRIRGKTLRVGAQPLLGLPGSLAALFAFGFPSAQLSHGLSVIVHTTPSKRLLPPARSEKASTHEAFSALS